MIKSNPQKITQEDIREVEVWAKKKSAIVSRLIKVLPDQKIRNGFKPMEVDEVSRRPFPDRDAYLNLINSIGVTKSIQEAIWDKNVETSVNNK